MSKGKGMKYIVLLCWLLLFIGAHVATAQTVSELPFKKVTQAKTADDPAMRTIQRAKEICEAYYADNKRYPDEHLLMSNNELKLPENVEMNYEIDNQGTRYLLLVVNMSSEIMYQVSSEFPELRVTDIKEQLRAYRIKANNSAAIADIKNARTCLEVFFRDFNRYPRDQEEYLDHACVGISEGVQMKYNFSPKQNKYYLETFHPKGDKIFTTSSEELDIKEKALKPI